MIEIRKNREFIPSQEIRKILDYWIGSLDDDWIIKNIKKELKLN